MPSFTQASRSDLELLRVLQRDFYAAESLQLNAAVLAAAEKLLDDDALGSICLISDDTGNAGYFVLTYGFSLERGGRFALLDELYIIPAARNRGLGKAAIAHAAELARSAGCRSLHLEVDQKNEAGQRLYRAAGFIQLNRYYLVLSLTSPTPVPHQK